LTVQKTQTKLNGCGLRPALQHNNLIVKVLVFSSMRMTSSLKAILIFLAYPVATSFQSVNSLKGIWEYEGGVYNGQMVKPPKAYKLQRTYDEAHYQGIIIKKDAKPEKYEAGNYSLKNNNYQETQIYSDKPVSKVNGTLHYTFSVKNNMLKFNGKLIGGAPVEEYWKKIK